MYAIAREIERLQNELEELNDLQDKIEIELDEAADLLADEVRERIGELINDIIYQNSSHTTEMLLDNTELENEMLEELSDKARMQF